MENIEFNLQDRLYEVTQMCVGLMNKEADVRQRVVKLFE